MPPNLRTRILALCVLTGACAPVPAPEPAAPSVMLASGEIAAVAEALRLEDRRELDTLALGRLLEHSTAEVRRRAALAVGRIGQPAGSTLLLGALADSATAADAAFALGLLGDSSAAVVQALARLAGGPDTEAAVEAVASLGRLRSAAARAAVEPLLAAAPAAAVPAPVRHQALLSIWRFPRRPETADALVAHLGAADPETRWRATYALMRIGEPRAVDALIHVLGDPDHRVREQAARGLRAEVADAGSARPRATAALTAALADEHPHVRISALRALGSYADSALAPAVVATLRGGAAADPAVRTNLEIVAAQTLGQLGGGTAAGVLDSLAAHPEARLALRGAAVAGLAAVAPERALERLVPLARSDDWLARLYAARALSGLAWAAAEPLLTELAADRDPRVAAAALQATTDIAGDTIPRAYAFFVEGLARSDPGVRAAAVRGLARRADPADLPLLLSAYEVAQRDLEPGNDDRPGWGANNDAALAAIDALGELAERGVPVARSFYLRFERPADPLVRAQAAARIGVGAWGPPRPIETGRDVAFYERIVRELVAPGLAGAPPPRATIRTAAGEIELELAGTDAPLTVYNFLTLARRGYFDGTRWHRVVPAFVVQDGDPRGDGNGGPGHAIRDELNRLRYARGTLGMALSGPDTGGSQFFLTHAPQPHLDGGYTVFGRVVSGMDVVDRTVQDDPLQDIRESP